jgi:magnesium chelatase family protein
MLARVLSACLAGVDAALVRVEVDVSQGLPTFATAGLPDPAVRESRERVRTAIRRRVLSRSVWTRVQRQ